MRKRNTCVILAAIFSLFMATTSFAGSWESRSGGWKYKNDDGAYVLSNWVNDSGVWYYLDGLGFMKTGWYQDGNGVWYYLDENTGAMVSGTTRNIAGVDYTFDANGAWVQPPSAMQDGWNGTTYVNRKMDYQITIPGNYQNSAGFGPVPIDENGELEMIAASPDGQCGVAISRMDMAEIQKYDLTERQMAMIVKDAYGRGGEVTDITYNDCNFAKLPDFMTDNGLHVDLYFRKVNGSMTLVEAIYSDESHRQEVEGILSTIRRPQG